MTQTHHMTWQTTEGADPGDTPCRTWLEEAMTDTNKSQVNNLTSKTNNIFSHFPNRLSLKPSAAVWRTSPVWETREHHSSVSHSHLNVVSLQRKIWMHFCHRFIMLDIKSLFDVTPYLQGKTSEIQWRTLPCLPSSQWPRCLQALSRPAPCLNLDLCQTNA